MSLMSKITFLLVDPLQLTMTEQHPITPPPELLHQWATEYWGNPGESIGEGEKYIATQAARWGSDQELEACCEWVEREIGHGREWGAQLRAARRPKPPSLREQALQELERVVTLLMPVTGPNKVERFAIIRRALEQLDD